MAAPGLAPYQQEALFFGREDAVQSLRQVLLSGERIALLYGERGVGKTSLVRAGLAPEWERRGGTLIYVDGRYALVEALSRAVEQRLGIDREAGQSELAHVREGLSTSRPLVVVIDHVESEFVQAQSTAVAEFFQTLPEREGLQFLWICDREALYRVSELERVTGTVVSLPARVELGRMGPGQVASVLREILFRGGCDRADELARQVAGSLSAEGPVLPVDLQIAAAAAAADTPSALEIAPQASGPEPWIALWLRASARRSGAEASGLATLCTLADEPLEESALQQGVRLPIDSLRNLLESLRRSGVVTETVAGWSLAHPRLQAIARTLGRRAAEQARKTRGLYAGNARGKIPWRALVTLLYRRDQPIGSQERRRLQRTLRWWGAIAGVVLALLIGVGMKTWAAQRSRFVLSREAVGETEEIVARRGTQWWGRWLSRAPGVELARFGFHRELIAPTRWRELGDSGVSGVLDDGAVLRAALDLLRPGVRAALDLIRAQADAVSGAAAIEAPAWDPMRADFEEVALWLENLRAVIAYPPVRAQLERLRDAASPRVQGLISAAIDESSEAAGRRGDPAIREPAEPARALAAAIEGIGAPALEWEDPQRRDAEALVARELSEAAAPAVATLLTLLPRLHQENAAHVASWLEASAWDPSGELVRQALVARADRIPDIAADSALGAALIPLRAWARGAPFVPQLKAHTENPHRFARAGAAWGWAVASRTELAAARAALEGLLDDRSPTVRAAAAEAMGRLGPEVQSVLERRIESEAPRVSRAAARGLVRSVGSARDAERVARALTVMWKDKGHRRRAATRLFGELGGRAPELALPILRRAIRQVESPPLRAIAVDAMCLLAGQGHDQARADLLRAVGDSQPIVRRALRRCLLRHRDDTPGVIALATRLADDADPRTRAVVAERLRSAVTHGQGTVGMASWIVRLADDDDLRVRAPAIEALAVVADRVPQEIAPAITRRFASAAAAERCGWLRVAARIRDRHLVERGLGDEDPQVRSEALRAAGNLPGLFEQALPRALMDADATVRVGALGWLAARGSEIDPTLLSRVLPLAAHAEDVATRVAALRLLARWGDAEAAFAHFNQARHALSTAARAEAATAVKALVVRDVSRALPVVEGFLADPTRDVRQAIAGAAALAYAQVHDPETLVRLLAGPSTAALDRWIVVGALCELAVTDRGRRAALEAMNELRVTASPEVRWWAELVAGLIHSHADAGQFLRNLLP